MTDAAASNPEKTASNLFARIGWSVLIIVTLYVCYFTHLGSLGFVGPDEPRYAWIARAMTETGDWVTPRLYGQPWFEKPPLFYWGAAASFKLFGVSEAAARLPSAFCALLATLALGWLAWRIYGAETARWLLLLLSTTVGMIGFSHAAATDMPFSGMVTIAMVCAAVVLRLPPRTGVATAATNSAAPAHAESPPQTSAARTPWIALLLFGFFLGLAVLAKGPAGIVLCGGAVLCWALITKRWRDAFRLLHPAAIFAFCVTALPWYVLCARRNPDFFRVFIIEHNFKRYLTPEFQHIQPFWFYVPVVLVAVLPWTALLVWSATIGILRLARDRQISNRAAFFLSWPVFCLLFFSASHSKLPGYILPALPAVCLCMAYYLVPLQSKVGFRAAHLLAAVALFGLCAVLGFVGSALHDRNQAAIVAASIVLGLIALANLFLGVFSLGKTHANFHRLAAAFCVVPILLALLFTNKLLPAFFLWDPSGRTIARELKARSIPGDELYVQAMKRGQQYSLDFYLRAETRAWRRDQPSEGYLLMPAHFCRAVVPPTWRCEEIPFDLRTGEFLYRVGPADSLNASSGGQLQ